MNLLHELSQLLEGHHQQPQQPQSHPAQGNLQAHQAPQKQLGNNTPQAHLYASNPMDPRVMHMDPAQFGYPEDFTGSPLQVQRGQSAGPGLPNMGVGFGNIQGQNVVPLNNLPQGGQFNPGQIQMQGRAFHPQMPAFNNPQDNQNGYRY